MLRARRRPTVNARMDYRYPPGAVRRLDDALLAAFAERYVELHGNAHRRAALRARLERLRDASEGLFRGGEPGRGQTPPTMEV